MRRPLLAAVLGMLALSFPAQADRLRNTCERTWPASKKPARQTTIDCVDHWLRTHAGFGNGEDPSNVDLGPYLETAIVTQLSAAQFRRMRDHVAAARAALPDGAYEQAYVFFDHAARSHMTTLDLTRSGKFADGSNIASQLDTVLAGKKLPTVGLADLSVVSLWKLRNAVYARHGRKFKSDDLNAFFYSEWKDEYRDLYRESPRPRALPQRQDPAFDESRLTRTDHRNVAAIKAAEREVAARPPVRLGDDHGHLSE